MRKIDIIILHIYEPCNFCCFLVTKSCLTVILWTVAHKAPLSMGFPILEYWSRLPLSSPGHLPDRGIEPALAGRLSFYEALKQASYFEMGSKKLMCSNITPCWEMKLPSWSSGWESTCQCRGIQFWSLVWEDPTYHRATSPRVITPEPVCCTYWSLCTLEPGLCSKEKSWQWKTCAWQLRGTPLAQLEKAHMQQQRPGTAKNAHF